MSVGRSRHGLHPDHTLVIICRPAVAKLVTVSISAMSLLVTSVHVGIGAVLQQSERWWELRHGLQQYIGCKQGVTARGRPRRRPKIVAGRVAKLVKAMALLEQPFIKDTEKTVDTIVKEATASIGEKISVRRFSRRAPSACALSGGTAAQAGTCQVNMWYLSTPPSLSSLLYLQAISLFRPDLALTSP